MSRVVIQGNASGTGNFTIAAPNSNTDRTLTLPDEAGTIRVDSVGATPLPIFHAYRTSNYSIGTSEAILIYDATKVNQGSHYNTTTGKFTAPVNGIYEFAWASIAIGVNDVFRYSLAINGTIESAKDELRLDLTATGSEYATNGEFSRYISLSANDTVEVQVSAGAAATGYGSPSYAYTYFRGRLIN
jgi:hypothetical protein